METKMPVTQNQTPKTAPSREPRPTNPTKPTPSYQFKDWAAL